MERISTTSPHGGLATVYNLFPEGDGFLSVKVAPSLKAKKIDEIYNDDIVKVINKNDNWSFIEYGDNFNKNGYVYNIYLRHLND